MLLRSKLFYCLQLPIQFNARGGDQNYAWNAKSCGVDAALQQTYFIVGTQGYPTREGRIDPFLMGRAYLTFWEKMV